MKSQKGITLVSVAIYIVLIFIVIAILATITTNMQNNLRNSGQEGIENAEINKFNMFFLQETKKQGIKIESISGNSITFSSGIAFEFDSNNNVINYIEEDGQGNVQKSIVISKDIQVCTFTERLDNGKTIITVTIQANNTDEYTKEYVLGSQEDTNKYEDENDYIKTATIPSTYAKAEDLNLGTNVSLVAYEELTGDIKNAADNGAISAVLTESINGINTIAVVPTGFTISPLAGENTVSDGLVIYEMTDSQRDAIDWTDASEISTAQSTYNQFVWIPVATLDDMVSEIEANSGNYRGVLANWNTDSTGGTPYSYNASSGKREPAILTDEIETDVAYDSQAAFTQNDGGTYVNTMYQTEFNKMVESVGKYEGFYIGRYETGGFNSQAIVIKGGETGGTSSSSANNSINYVTWYKAYKMQKDYASGRGNLASSMIWGCQWDQVMRFIDDKQDGEGNTYNVTAGEAVRHTESIAGSGSNTNDKVQNIYDLEGNVREWTMEAVDTGSRSYRGGNYSNSNAAAVRSDYYPNDISSKTGSRITLYIN